MNKRILILTGDGKGKTTSALGTAFRSLGNDLKVAIIQFIKIDITGEHKFVKSLPFYKYEIDIFKCGLGFVPKKDNTDFTKHVKQANEAFYLSKGIILSSVYDIVILDEICNAIKLELIQEDEVIDLLKIPNINCHIILTGRDASDKLIECADTVTEMRCIKHGYDSGIKATEGIEY